MPSKVRITMRAKGSDERSKEEEHVGDPNIPCRVGTARGRHVTSNIGHKPKLITTTSILLEMPRLSTLHGDGCVAHKLAIIDVDVDVVHLPFLGRNESIPALSPWLCLAEFRLLARSPRETRSASGRVKKVRDSSMVREWEDEREGEGED